MTTTAHALSSVTNGRHSAAAVFAALAGIADLRRSKDLSIVAGVDDAQMHRLISLDEWVKEAAPGEEAGCKLSLFLVYTKLASRMNRESLCRCRQALFPSQSLPGEKHAEPSVPRWSEEGCRLGRDQTLDARGACLLKLD